MPCTSSLLLGAFFLLVNPAVAQPAATPCKAGVRRVELPTVPTQVLQEACISPGLATTFSFDADILRESITLEGRERFAKVEVGDSLLKLVPTEKLVPGEKPRLTLRFKDGAAPASAVFILVVQAAQADTYVEVRREKRTVESCQQELKESTAELQQCRAENEQLRAARNRPDGLRGLIVADEIDMTMGVLPGNTSGRATWRAGSPFRGADVFSYRSKHSMAVALELVIPAGATPFAVGRAKLEGKGQNELSVLGVWPAGLLIPDKYGKARVIVEAKAPEGAAQGPFTLRLWDEGGKVITTIDKVTFP